MKSLKNDVKPVITGKSLGIPMPPLIILIIEIPTAMTRKTTASATERADVNLNESGTTEQTRKNLYGFIIKDEAKYLF